MEKIRLNINDIKIIQKIDNSYYPTQIGEQLLEKIDEI